MFVSLIALHRPLPLQYYLLLYISIIYYIYVLFFLRRLICIVYLHIYVENSCAYLSSVPTCEYVRYICMCRYVYGHAKGQPWV